MLKRVQQTCLLGLASLLFTSTVQAQFMFEQQRSFFVNKTCQAYTSFKKQTQPVDLETNAVYAALGENKENGSHIYIQVDGKNKWVSIECGYYQDPLHTTTPATPPPSNNNTQCLPFFDDQDNPVKVKVGGKIDITPPAPMLEPFGHAVNATCGKAGKVVSAAEFKDLLRQHPEVLKRLQAFTNNRVFADRPAATSSEAYLADLSKAWFKLKAFDHIFCGEPKAGSSIGGLHYHGRYLQLQQSGEACRMNNHRQNEVIPGVVYSMGVIMKAANGSTARSSIKGYGLTLSAEDILKVVTRALAENPASGNKSAACLLPIRDDGKKFTTVFVRRATGIRTFYPDATPAARDPKCKAAINLQP